MSKFTREEKLNMIAEYHERKMTLNAICRKYGISHSALREILERYKKDGPDDIGTGKLGHTYARYPGIFKLEVIKERIASGVGYREIARKYGIGHALVMKWERAYLEGGEQALLEEQRGKQVKEANPAKGRRGVKKINKQVKGDLIAEIQQLRMENEYLKKLNALIHEEKKSPRS
ncbi:MAG: helix-turn-helix domain-containing protein [Ethanoligenens sp.]